MTTASTMYAQSLDQCALVIAEGGHKRTVLVEGHMGSGKSSLLSMVSALKPKHKTFYFDCNTKTDAGDIGLPQFSLVDEQGYVTYVSNEELGFHIDGPIILMIDEFGKANKSVQNACLRTMLERRYGNKKLHPESIIFSTTNLGAEGVGDLLMPHVRNRITVIRNRKANSLEMVEYGLNNDFHPSVLGWVHENPQVMQSYEEVSDPSDNPYIFHPQQQRAAFVTGRSIEAASDWLHAADRNDAITDDDLRSLLIGTIGDRGALDLMAFVTLANQLPTTQSIIDDPLSAIVPTSASALCMVVFRTLGSIDKSWVTQWMSYMGRLDKEAQGMFVNGVRSAKYNKQSVVMTNNKFKDWALANKHLYSADKI